MDAQTLFKFLFQLYDYADYLADNIRPDGFDNKNYFMSLLYIEEMMDSYGRGLISRTARDINENDSKSLSDAHRRIDLLRGRIRQLQTQYGFDDVINVKTQKLLQDWNEGLRA